MSLSSVLHLCGAALLVAVGVMLAAVGSLVVGGLLLVGGGVWVVWSLRRM